MAEVKQESPVIISKSGEDESSINLSRKSKEDAKKMSKVKNIVHLWDRKQTVNLFDGIILASHEGVENEGQKDKSFNNATDNLSGIMDEAIPDIRFCGKMFCVTCSTDFEDREEQKEHFRSDWHRFNLKRKLKGETVVTETKFEEITKSGDLSSISGSDSSSEDDEDNDEDLTRSSKSSQQSIEDEDLGGGHVEGIGKRHPRIFIRNGDGELLSVYRCVVHGKKNQPDTAEDLLSLIHHLPTQTKWCVLMFAGGHFAGAVFDGDTVVEHKTFHRYVVRAKRGTVQSSRDGKGHAPKSGGASLRRYNEAALAAEVQELISSWSTHVASCQCIFLRLPTHNKAVLFGGKSPLFDKRDPRIRLIPFQTRRPTFKELKRVVDLLSSVECYGKESSLMDHISPSPKKLTAASLMKESHTGLDTSLSDKMIKREVPEPVVSDDSSSDFDMESKFVTETMEISTADLRPFEVTRKPRRKKKNKKKAKDEDVQKGGAEQEGDENWTMSTTLDPDMLALRNDLYTACKTGDAETLTNLLHERCVKVTEEPNGLAENLETSKPAAAALLNCHFGQNRATMLHVAVQAGHKDVVTALLGAGADPSNSDQKGVVPYLATSSKEIRNTFRRFVAQHPDMYDYTKAQIPGPLSDEQEKERKAREADRKKAMKKAKKERLKEKRTEEEKEREENRERLRFLSLSDREKRALAAERRLTAQVTSQGQQAPVLSRCYQCGGDITGKVPFEYSEYKFCTTKCLKEHRAQKSSMTSKR